MTPTVGNATNTNTILSMSQASNSGANTPNSPPQSAITNSSLVGNNSNRLLFNRLATERKTVHVMNSNLKEVSKRDRQMLASYNNSGTGTGTSGTGTLTNGGGAGTLTSNNASNLHQTYAMGNPSTLDYNMTTGRSHTNASSFLQKLSSKFTRR